MPGNLQKMIRRTLHAGMAMGLLGIAGCCAGHRPVSGAPYHGVLGDPPTGGVHVYTISFDGNGCPFDAEMESAKRNCAGKDRRCVKVDRKQKAVVVFQAEGKGEFALYFDPFLKAPLRSKDGRLQLDIPADAPPKEYSFNIAAEPRGKCGVIDPRIIVE